MIIDALMTVVYGFFDLLTSGISIPPLPDGVVDVITTVLSYISAGMGFLANYCHLGYLVSLFGVIVAVDAGMLIYKLVMWIIKKIPMLGIE